METLELSVVIPAYNEEKRIQRTISKICEYFKDKNAAFEVIVVDDGSIDSTRKIVLSMINEFPNVKLIVHSKNAGKGAAVQTGVLAAKGKMVLVSDADLSTPISEIEKMEHFIFEGYDIVIGSRKLKDSVIPIPQPWHRKLSGWIFQFLVHQILRLSISDTQCGFKLFKLEVAKKIFSNLKHKGFIFDVEILFRATQLNYCIKEIGVIWMNSPYSTVRIFRDSIRMFIDLIKIRFGK
ncbi:MAG TPA: glycosyltransferase family 2 protein [bacterium]|nr:glycosyltransferase family 2 protein [bacterium]